jgi:hypothetical protein
MASVAQHYRIGGIQLALEQDTAVFGPAWRGFAPYAHSSQHLVPNIQVRASAGALPHIDTASMLERGPGFWSAYAAGERTLFACHGRGQHAGAWRVIVSDAQAERFEVITRPDASFLVPGAPLPDPLAFPSAELIVLSHIARRDAAILHACGVRDHDELGTGYLFCGRSGAGKSTTARLWQGHGLILNDDRVLVRRGRDGAFRVHGTPWHGDVRATDPGCAPIRGVFFLEHATSHQVIPLSVEAAQRQLLTSVWLPLWDRAGGMAHTLRLCRELVSEVPCFRLRFRRDSEVVNLVRAAAGSGRQDHLAVPA